MGTLAHRGAELWFEALGEGDLLVALHGGLGLDHTCLRPWLDPLAESFRLAYLDLRGNGRSTGDLGPGTMQSLADDVDALREHLGADRTWLIGHSYGGFVALQYALSHPDRLSGMVLCDTGSHGPRPDTMADGLQALGAGDDVMAAFGEPVETTEDMLAWFERVGWCYLPHSPADLGLQVMASTVFRKEGSELGDRALDGWDVTPRLGEITAPVLVVAGEDDFMFPPAVAQRLADGLPAGQAVVVERAGHLPFVEQQEAFLTAAREWIDVRARRDSNP